MERRKSFFIRMALPSDVPECHAIDVEAWGEDAAAPAEMLQARIDAYPCGNFVAIDSNTGTMIGSVWSVSVKDERFTTWMDISGGGTYQGVRDYAGSIVYGVNVSVRAEYAGLGTAQSLIVHGCGVAKGLGKRGAKMGCRIPEYHRWQKVFSSNDYLHVLQDGEYAYYRDPTSRVVMRGPTLTELRSSQSRIDPSQWSVPEIGSGKLAQLDGELAYFMSLTVQGDPCRLYGLMPGYFTDPDSCDNGVLIGWEWESDLYPPGSSK